MNYFAPRTAAQRYAKGRPDVHSYTIHQLRDFLHLDEKLEHVLDIACGTGLSTNALLEVGNKVYGTDISPEMLELAPNRKLIHYSLAPAEDQPFADRYFDLITVSSGVHWFNIERFLTEASRLLKIQSYLVLYENYFDSSLQSDDQFKEWVAHTHYQRFPTPPKNKYSWSDETTTPFGLHYVTEWRSAYSIPMTKQQFACYLTTQSNVIAAVEAGALSFEEVDAWLDHELDPFFFPGKEPRYIRFGNWIKFLKKI
ncbi:MAG TPA: methyltransferase domain-containing protein [Puia sp.]|jgi:ubiquinone/menaquinone biosynthesis C-methylase UbiE|nr:methyltransferase domain-containing protein [Puia sp.]